MPVDYAAFAAVLRDLGVVGSVRELPASAPTATTAAEQLGCEVGAIANSLIFDADDAPLLIMTSGAHRVDTAAVASLLGVAAVRRASPEAVRTWTGQAIGGVGPVGHPAPIRTLVDNVAGHVRRDLGSGRAPAHRLSHLVRGTRPHHRRHARRRRPVSTTAPAPS